MSLSILFDRDEFFLFYSAMRCWKHNAAIEFSLITCACRVQVFRQFSPVFHSRDKITFIDSKSTIVNMMTNIVEGTL